MIDGYRKLMETMPVIGHMVTNLVLAIIILVVGWTISVFVGRAIRRFAVRSRSVDPTIVPMVHTVTVWTIRSIVLIAVLARFGVQTASIIAVLGAAGLTIGLALQGTLQNIAAGIMLLALRPLRAGETISIVGKAEGTVEEIGLFLSRLVQGDGTYVSLPNSMIWGSAIVNYSRNTTRHLELQISARYGRDLDPALDQLRKLVQSHELVLADPKPEVVVGEYMANTVVVTIRAWSRSSAYGTLNQDLHRQAIQVLERAGLYPPIAPPP